MGDIRDLIEALAPLKLGGEQIAEMLWLARCIEDGEQPRPRPRPIPARPGRPARPSRRPAGRRRRRSTWS
ncbi:hypothetical protein ACFQ9X_30290 [Catenulispora yoronensis]